MRTYLIPSLAITLHSVTCQDLPLPTCWLHYGECLDNNQPPLDVQTKVKPLNNENVIKVEKDIFTIEDCNKKCEESAECAYYTLYKNDLNKNCKIVGFNLGHACNYLSNVCVLLRECYQFNSTCDRGCVTGRRLLKDETKQYKTLIVGGIKDQRLKHSEYETSIEVLNEIGESKCPLYIDKTDKREGASSAFFEGSSLTNNQIALLCGGWFTTSKDDSLPKQSFLKGEYFKTCEKMQKGQNWDKTNTIDMIRHRAFFSMAATDRGMFAFGGYNNYKGFLDNIEYIDLTAATPAWVELGLKLSKPRSHTCAASVRFKGRIFVIVVGGWDDSLEYVADVDLFNVDEDDGTLTLNMTLEMPADRSDDEARTRGRADTACMAYRRHNWMEGLLITGGYREAGAWLNTAYWLNLTAVFDPNLASPSLAWERVTNISPMFDGGRHNHALSTTAMLPAIIGGWRNKALDTMLLLDECEEDDDLTRMGVWSDHDAKLKIGREKFAALSVPRSFLVGTDFCTDN